MSPLLPAAAGAAGGLGISLIICTISPAAPRLDAALTRLETTSPTRDVPLPGHRTVGSWLADHLDRPGGLTIPRADLAILGQSTEAYLVRKLTATAAGLVCFSLAGALAAALGIQVAWEMPAAVSILAAAGMFVFVDYDVRANAARRRRDFTHSWISYLQLVRLTRSAGAGSTEALEYAARKGDGWVFGRINDAIEQAARAHQPPWASLAELGTQIGVPEVVELADTVQIAGSEGTKIAATLAAKSSSLRRQLQASSRARANSRTTTMVVPLGLLGIGFVVLIAFPSLYALLFTTP